jgi:orotidine-5'-phosphate decarboxylase
MKIIFIALDTDKIANAKKIIRLCSLSKLNIGFKIGLQLFFLKGGRDFVNKISKKYPVFLDLKISDISNTSKSAIKSLKDINFSYITVHINSGYETILAVKKEAKKINKKIKVLGVSVLTSLNQKSFKEIGHTKSIKLVVAQKARLAKKAKLDGIICSGEEIKIVKKNFKGLIIVPGIRFKDNKKQDQKRVFSPKDVLIKKGCDGIVIGRSIIKGNIKTNLKKLSHELS